MISVNEAEKIIQQSITPFPAEERALSDAYSAILREDLKSDRDQPPFNKSLMDGIAIHGSSFRKGQRTFLIEGIASAGEPQKTLSLHTNAYEIMTGAVVPDGCDVVIPIEDIKRDGENITIDESSSVDAFRYIRKQGADCKKGDILLKAGKPLNAPQISLAASIGKSTISVTRKISVAIISTGNELVALDTQIKDFQTRRSNSYAIDAALSKTNLCSTQIFHIRDDKNMLRQDLGQALKKFDVLILSGGVSMGKFDFVPEILTELGVNNLFHKVEQKPGKPMWFGKNKEGVLVFALPGNPASTMMCLYRYVLPALNFCVGANPTIQLFAALTEDYVQKSNLTIFLPVKTCLTKSGQFVVEPHFFGGSGDFASLAPTDGFIEIPPGEKKHLNGDTFKYFSWSA